MTNLKRETIHRPRKSSALLKFCFYMVLLCALFLGAIFLYGFVEFHRAGSQEFVAELEVPKGATLRWLSRQLEKNNQVRSADLFYWTARLLGQGGHIQAGRYALTGDQSPSDVLYMLSHGHTLMSQLTIPEGLTNHQVCTVLKEHPDVQWNLNLKQIEAIPEGALFPETYTFSSGTLASELLRAMQLKMNDTLAQLWERRGPDFPLKSKKEALVLASIVEKETGLSEERPRVARVFLNRLQKKMPLQADPTVIYGLSQRTGVLGRDLSKKDLRHANVHNTYKNRGLPPTPIANPGLSSLRAVFSPSDSSDLYFVANGNGGHRFASGLPQHRKNVKLYRSKK